MNLTGLWSRIKEVAMTQIGGSGVAWPVFPGQAPAEIRWLLECDATERLRQQELIMARRYHEGRHPVRLTRRLQRYLGDEAELFLPRLNFTRKISRGLAARLVVESLWSTAPEDAERTRQSTWANALWGWDGGGSRMPQKRPQLHTALVRDGEAYLLVDFDLEHGRARLTPHERFVDAETEIEGERGSGEGVRLYYPDDDADQPPLCGTKRWTARVPRPDGSMESEARLTVYWPNRVQKWKGSGSGWILVEELPWTRDGRSGGPAIGIPFVHLRTPEMKPAAREAIPIQKGLNKLYLDMLAASDFDAWRLLVAFGWEPPAEIEPGTVIGSTRSPSEASIQAIEPGEPGRQLALLDKLIDLMSDVTNVPLTLLQRSGQRAAEGTLQEEKEDFIKLVQDYADALGAGYSDALRIARKLENVFGSTEPMEESCGFEVKWGSFWARTTSEKQGETSAMLAAGFPREEIWREVWGKSESDLERLGGFGEK